MVPTAGPTCQGREATIVGDAGDNILQGTASPDVFVARGGNDTIFAKGGNDVICAGPGNDVIYGGPGADIIIAGGGNDDVTAGSGADRVWGGFGRDVIRGNLGPDHLRGGPGADRIEGGRGHDPLLSGDGHADVILGGAGFDVLRGASGNDKLIGGYGNDDLFGGAGTDDLRGQQGFDRCFDGETHRSCEIQTWSPITLSGSGDDIVAFKAPGNATAVVRFSYSSGSNFAVWSRNVDLGLIDLLVNEIGAYEGGRAINTGSFFDEPARFLDVTASGPWTAVVEPLALARSFSNVIEGTTDDVVRIESSGILDMTFTGPSNFAIWAYEPDGDLDLLVNEIGNTTAAAVVGTQVTYLDITGIGSWTLDFR